MSAYARQRDLAKLQARWEATFGCDADIGQDCAYRIRNDQGVVLGSKTGTLTIHVS